MNGWEGRGGEGRVQVWSYMFDLQKTKKCSHEAKREAVLDLISEIFLDPYESRKAVERMGEGFEPVTIVQRY